MRYRKLDWFEAVTRSAARLTVEETAGEARSVPAAPYCAAAGR
jgi:hypothetical protein